MNIITITSREEFLNVLSSKEMSSWKNTESKIAEDALGKEYFYIEGYCNVCEHEAQFYGDWLYSNGKMPNYRERLVCGTCKLNNRQRLIAYLVKKELQGLNNSSPEVFCYEAVTPFYKWLKSQYPSAIGSEFLGPFLSPGSIVKGIRHEDATNLSFPDVSLNLLISQDVFEHVPDLSASIKEVRRVLKTGGVIFFSIPFYANSITSMQRATMQGDNIIHLLEPVYHGNPIDKNGSLVFWDIGWDIFDLFTESGMELKMIALWDLKFGHIGDLPFIFKATTL